jgi:hypothetical protein
MVVGHSLFFIKKNKKIYKSKKVGRDGKSGAKSPWWAGTGGAWLGTCTFFYQKFFKVPMQQRHVLYM